MGRAALVGFLLAAVVVMLGAWTRLMDAGLGCPDWPGCYGFIHVPQSAEQIAVAEARFPDAKVEVAKGWPEMIHRYFAGTLGLVIFGIAAYALKHRRHGLPLKLPLALAVLVVLQAAFGMWTVTLKLWPQVVAAHLLGGFTTLTLLFLLTLRLRARPLSAQEPSNLARFKPWLGMAIAVVVMQIALGAWTASNYAAVACTELPTCHGQWWPAMDWAHGFNVFQHIGPNYLGGQLSGDGRTAIHMAHRMGALVVLVFVGTLLVVMALRARGTPLTRWLAVSAGLLGLQIALGLANVAFQLPLAVAVAHNAGGAALLLSLVNLAWRLHPANDRVTVTEPPITNREATA
ncbi:COX15/CtaA family protein [Marinobacteraceae bacterium S3BR75-40.1]